MTGLFMRGSAALGAVAVGVLAMSASAATVTTTFLLKDHPDGNVNPPPYGLRFDNLFTTTGGPGGATTFSMEQNGAKVRLIVTKDTDTNISTIRIVGKVYGGRDIGATVGFGAGLYSLDYSYRVNVAEVGTGWRVDGPSALNNGTLVSDGNADVALGTTYSFSDKGDDKGRSFYFLQDEHRLAGHAEAGQGYWVGRGWHMLADGTMLSGSQDFLFIGKLIPLPSPAAMGVAGLLGLAALRRRR